MARSIDRPTTPLDCGGHGVNQASFTPGSVPGEGSSSWSPRSTAPILQQMRSSDTTRAGLRAHAMLAAAGVALVVVTGAIGSAFSPLAIPFVIWASAPYVGLWFAGRSIRNEWVLSGAGAAAFGGRAGPACRGLRLAQRIHGRDRARLLARIHRVSCHALWCGGRLDQRLAVAPSRHRTGAGLHRRARGARPPRAGPRTPGSVSDNGDAATSRTRAHRAAAHRPWRRPVSVNARVGQEGLARGWRSRWTRRRGAGHRGPRGRRRLRCLDARSRDADRVWRPARAGVGTVLVAGSPGRSDRSPSWTPAAASRER